MTFTNLLLIVLGFAAIVSGLKCPHPNPAPNFTLEKYSGLWYEIGKVQTVGGGFFERNCQCTRLDVSSTYSVKGVYTVAENICRWGGPGEETRIANGTLTDAGQPGMFTQKFYSYTPTVDYTVIYLDDNYAIEFDCGGSIDINYCIHIMSRTPTMPDSEYNFLLNFALKQGLNLKNLPDKKTIQNNCDY